MRRAHHQEPAQSGWKSLLLPGGQRGQPWLSSALRPLSPSCTHLFSNQSLRNIKYKTLPYSISNHSIYKFIFSKKKKKVKDTVIQHNSSFPFLLERSLKRHSRSRKHSGMVLPSRGVPRERDSPLTLEFAQNRSCRDIQTWEILGLSSLEAKWPRHVQAILPPQGGLPQGPAPPGSGNSLSQEVPMPPSMAQWYSALLNHHGLWY